MWTLFRYSDFCESLVCASIDFCKRLCPILPNQPILSFKQLRFRRNGSLQALLKVIEVEKTFDVRGLMQDSARVQIEGYFDQALLNNIETIKIIHGKGTGALRNLVKALVREYKTTNQSQFNKESMELDLMEIRNFLLDLKSKL